MKNSDFDAAISRLTAEAEICEHNAQIQRSEGRVADAENSLSNARSYRLAVQKLY